MSAVNTDNINDYFDLLKEIFDTYDFHNHLEAVSSPLSSSSPLAVRSSAQSESSSVCTAPSSMIPVVTSPTFTTEEELKYARRYEEGYDLFDPHYNAWLQINHPEAANTSNASVVVSSPSSHSNNNDQLPSPLSSLSSSPLAVRSSTQSDSSSVSTAPSSMIPVVTSPTFTTEE